ncbi:hypothetical protein GALMADRAFT_77316 [Galerina marginata CBS 339.88]|uniref:Fatty acid desaturase domain-containing protein n=1 Tax=Galerina marginata (strain CBS 339.88) TaxID=685588 RepID=A0A067SS16_GALM3|nr:hypothetical protein GALMADRAFT_77316 [Galerina marginata CBS 339.88]
MHPTNLKEETCVATQYAHPGFHYDHRILSVCEIRALIPSRLFRRNTSRSVAFLIRDLIMVVALSIAVYTGDTTLISLECATIQRYILRACIWLFYWWFQGLIFTGIWVIGHECGHGSFSSSRGLSDLVGFLCHSALWTPYFSWKFSHQSHHRHHGSMEKDEHWIPRSRSELGISVGPNIDHVESYFDDTPIITVFRLLIQQFLGFPAYLLMNASGQSKFPLWTSHFNPFSSSLFKRTQRNHVMASNFGILLTGWIIYLWASKLGPLHVLRLYGLPLIAAGHWVTMIVFLQHTDPSLPHYRENTWNFLLGALSTMDRDFLGWQGRFFLHNIAHFHTVHHLFPTIPFYHAEEATEIIKRALSHRYHSSSEPVFRCLWENFNSCQFVEDEDQVLYYKDGQGRNRILGKRLPFSD